MLRDHTHGVQADGEEAEDDIVNIRLKNARKRYVIRRCFWESVC